MTQTQDITTPLTRPQRDLLEWVQAHETPIHSVYDTGRRSLFAVLLSVRQYKGHPPLTVISFTLRHQKAPCAQCSHCDDTRTVDIEVRWNKHGYSIDGPWHLSRMRLPGEKRYGRQPELTLARLKRFIEVWMADDEVLL